MIACSGHADPEYPKRANELDCEPTGLIDLPQGRCIGTPAAQAHATHEGCRCINEEYVAVPNGGGHVCIHLHNVLVNLRHIHLLIEELNVPGPTGEDLYYNGPEDSARAIAIRLYLLSRDAVSLDAALRKDARQKRLDRLFKRVQQGIALLGTQTRRGNCIMSPPPTSRTHVLNMHKPLE